MNPIFAHAGETGSKLFTAEHLHVLLNQLPIIGLAFGAAALAMALAGTTVSSWIALAGGQVRHPEFRSGPPSSAEESTPHEH